MSIAFKHPYNERIRKQIRDRYSNQMSGLAWQPELVVSSNKRGRGKKSTYDPGTTPAVSTPYLNADELNAVDQGHKLMLTGSGLPGQATSFGLDRAADTIPSLIVGAVPELLPALPALQMASNAVRRKLKEKTGFGLNQSQQQAAM